MSKYRITLNGTVYEMEIERVDGSAAAAPAAPAASKPAPAPASAPAPKAPAAAPQAASAPQASGAAVRSPMPGTILRIFAAEGRR